VETSEGWLYLAAIVDLFSRMVVGWAMAATEDGALVELALRMAVARRHPEARLLHHSDRGTEWTIDRYQTLSSPFFWDNSRGWLPARCGPATRSMGYESGSKT
jgi:transposase InsO family protein